MVELVTLLKEVLSKAPEHEYDTISYQQFLGQFEQDLDDKCCDADQFIDGLGWLPGNCDCCAKHRPCSAVRHPPHERLYSWMIEGIVLKATSAWPKRRARPSSISSMALPQTPRTTSCPTRICFGATTSSESRARSPGSNGRRSCPR